MIRPYFSSTSNTPLNQIVLSLLDKAVTLSQKHTIEIQIMCFSFTDDLIYQKLKYIAHTFPNITIKILADWGNISNRDDRKIYYLNKFSLPNLHIRFKYDQPYLWDSDQQKLKWCYNTSLGLLHHRTILVIKNNEPYILQTGSFNWTKQALKNYENILEITAPSDKSETYAIIKCFEKEFDTLWNNFDLSLSPIHSIKHLHYIRNQYLKTPDLCSKNILLPSSIYNQPQQIECTKKIMLAHHYLVAFSGKHPFLDNRPYGFHKDNCYRYFMLKKNTGTEKKAPINITTLSLDFIARTRPHTILRIAFYALSPRVAEYGALLQAARKGVILKMILDREVNIEIINKIKEVANRENLNIEVRYGKRSMHQKYMVDQTNANILTGTANMTTDAEKRHAEHRFFFKNNPSLAQKFVADFDMIWKRIKY